MTSHLAVDLGATSGRVILGGVVEGRLEHRVLHRFDNPTVRLPDGLHWDLVGLFHQILTGLRTAFAETDDVVSIGIDSWAVDYGLLRGDTLLGTPFHYRDSRCERGVAVVHEQVDAAELHAINGLQHLPFNTVFQLAAEDLLPLAEQILLVPDLIAHWLTGHRVAERTNASTTGLLDVHDGEWSEVLMDRLGLDRRLFPDLVDPGTVIGTLRPELAADLGAPSEVEVVAVGSHDTASAVLGVPMADPSVTAWISSGTWSLVGTELAAPVVGEQVRSAGFTNEAAVGGGIRFLHNVMGMWLLNESLRRWPDADLADLLGRVTEADLAAAPVIDTEDRSLLAPADMPAALAALSGLETDDRDGLVACVLASLAAAYARAVADLERLTGRRIEVVHIVGGGSLNAPLCAATARACGVPVLAGPVEATAIGNLLVQVGRAAGDPLDPAALRKLVTDSVQVQRHLPVDPVGAE